MDTRCPTLLPITLEHVRPRHVRARPLWAVMYPNSLAQSSPVQSSLRTLCTRGCTCIVQQMGSATLARPPAGRIDRIKKCLADAEVRRGRESRAMNGRGEEGDRGARYGSRRRDSPGPLKSETAQSSCPRPLVQAAALLRAPRPRPLRPVRRP